MKSIVWFVSGASRGFGLEIARAALDRGDSVVAGARNPQAIASVLGGSERLLPVALDVTDGAQVQAAVDHALERVGRIDVLVNNAGHGLVGAVEEASAEETRSVFAVNVDGLLALTRAVLPSMRARHEGRIINLSCGGGLTATPGFGVYAATKFAVEGLSKAMHAELKPLGIEVIILKVEPGIFRTDFLDPSSLHRASRVIDDYASTCGMTRQWAAATNHEQPGDPAKAAAAIIAVATSPSPPLRLQLGAYSVARRRPVSAQRTDIR